jgi:hypothetical protein
MNLLTLAPCAALLSAQPVSPPPWEQPPVSEQITQPRRPNEADLKQIAVAKATLESGHADVSRLLTDPSLMPLHELTPFRELIRDYAKSNTVTIVTTSEPGERLTVTGMIRDAGGKPAAGALVYLYQTSAKG